MAKGVSVGRIEEKLLRLSKEQYARLDELEANARCLFEGAAGTGKTLLALEYARRASGLADRRWLSSVSTAFSESRCMSRPRGTGVAAGTWHGIAKRLILASSIASDFRGERAQGTGRRRHHSSYSPKCIRSTREVALEESGDAI